ncbi:MAG: FtsX-like permease family protein [Roseivirga sp.]|nr:FtsX-like permease family protein [Roseivirga sp.]
MKRASENKRRNNIPALGERLLSFLLPDDKEDILLGDFIECYRNKLKSTGKLVALLWFWTQVCASVPSFVRYRTRFAGIMLRSYVTLALRNLYKQAGYSFLNLSGLAVGIACFVVILLYVKDEQSFDTFHQYSKQTYRLLDFRKIDGIGEESASAPILLGEAMKADYSDEIRASVRFFNFQAPTLAMAYTPANGEVRQFNERKLFFTDPDFFEVFDFRLSAGDEGTALTEPNQVLITREMANKYFGETIPLGKVLRFEDKHNLVVSGVFDELPSNTHLDFDFLVSFSTLENPEVLRTRLKESWIWNPAWTYLVLNENVNPADMEAKFPDFVKSHFDKSRHDRVKLYLQPLEDIHLESRLDYEMGPNSDKAYVYVFTTIAIFILLISCFNFINLTTARSTRRAREIGMRKILGGYRTQLIGQFLSESVITSLVSLALAFPVIWLLLKVMNNFSGKNLSLNWTEQPMLLPDLLGLTMLIGLISGIYPAFFLSSYRPAQAVKGGRYVEASRGIIFRKVLVVGQFSLSVILIVGTTIALKQLDFLQKRSLGFDQEKVLLLPTLRSPLMEQYASFKGRLLDNPNVLSLTTVEDIPGVKHQTGGYRPDGKGEEQQFPRLVVHDDFAKTMGIELAAGRGFSAEFKTDPGETAIINRAMLDLLGWGSPEEAIGKSFDSETVVGVTENFHFTSLHRPVGPFVLTRIGDGASNMAFSARYIAVRVNTEQIDETLEYIQDQWFSFTPNRPFEYLFLGDLLGAQYEAEATLGKVAGAFAGLSVLIACLGLFGLASFTTERRIKEIGIRKVMGATVTRLVVMLSSSFVKLVLLSIVIASPVAYLALNSWLSDFAYRTSIGVWPFVSSGAIAVLIVLLTVSYQTIRAASTNPVNSLRYE